MEKRIKKYCELLAATITPATKPEDVNALLVHATSSIEIDKISVPIFIFYTAYHNLNVKSR